MLADLPSVLESVTGSSIHASINYAQHLLNQKVLLFRTPK